MAVCATTLRTDSKSDSALLMDAPCSSPLFIVPRGHMAYRPFHETLELCALGGAVQALLPKGYSECDTMLQLGESRLESADAQSEDTAIYGATRTALPLQS